MTKEQEEAIEIMKHWIDYEKNNIDKINKADELIRIQETVLSMLKEKDKEMEKKDKIIDRMPITIIQRDIGKNYCEFNKSCEKCEDGSRDFKCKDCIKQYFKELVERKSEEWKKI